MDKKTGLIIQSAITGLIFLLFLLSVFFIEGYRLPWLMIPLVIANIVFLFVNKIKGLIVNILLLIMSLLMFIVVIEYIASIIGLILSGYFALRIAIKDIKQLS